MNRQILTQAVERWLACPVCRGQLTCESEFQALRCDVCRHDYRISDGGIPVLLPPGPSALAEERRFRDALAAEQLHSDSETLVKTAARHHSVRAISDRARRCRAQFTEQELLLDIEWETAWDGFPAGEPRITSNYSELFFILIFTSDRDVTRSVWSAC